MTFHAFLIGAAALSLAATNNPAQNAPQVGLQNVATLSSTSTHTTTQGTSQIQPEERTNLPAVYCSGKTGSNGCVPTISTMGTPSLTGSDDFVMMSDQLPNNVLGVLVWGLAPSSTPFGGGTLCVASPVLSSFGVLSSGGGPGKATDCSGAIAFDVHQAFFTGQGLTAGTSVYMQFLVRDPGFPTPDTVVLSDALTYVLQP